MHGTDPMAHGLPGFVGGTLDRVDHIRSNPALHAQVFASPNARLLILEGLEPVTDDHGLALAPLAPDARIEQHVLLGVDLQDRPIFARLVDTLEQGPNATPRSRGLADLVSASDVALYGTARSLVF